MAFKLLLKPGVGFIIMLPPAGPTMMSKEARNLFLNGGGEEALAAWKVSQALCHQCSIIATVAAWAGGQQPLQPSWSFRVLV